MSLEKAKEKEIIECLVDSDWNITKAAKSLEISRATLYRYMKKYSIVRK